MIKAKILAMCVCPTLAAPPTILAFSPPARHAVAHVLHHAARRLDHGAPAARTVPAVPAVAAAPIPCPPAIALSAVATVPLALDVAPVAAGPVAALADPRQDRPGDALPSPSSPAARSDVQAATAHPVAAPAPAGDQTMPRATL